ncbi:MAG: M14 family zinc carboxypeptidase [Halothiobacillaceae bacterium]
MTLLPFGDAVCSRSSPAWHPETGRACDLHVPRVSRGQPLLEPRGLDTLYHAFPDTVGFTAYDHHSYYRTGETTNYYVEEIEETADNLPSSIVRWGLTNSYQGRPVEAFRLGPVNREHFVINAVMHGNEVDGMLGTLKGFEVICNHPDFAPLRERYSLMLIPVLNPDGYHLGTRFAAQTDSTGAPINMNRNWPYFWEEYVPTPSEGKGDYPLDTPECAALHSYWKTGNSGSPVPFRFLLDVHSTVGDGTRYQSRDRTYHEYPEDDWMSIWADVLIWNHARGLQAKRSRADGRPDLFTRMYRSRYRPHLHPWWQTRMAAENNEVPAISMVVEHNKVAFTELETYQSANDYNVDYIAASALVMQGGAHRKRAAILVEGQEATNQFRNPDWQQWQPDELRPGWWTPTRSFVERILPRSDRALDHHGYGLRLQADTAIRIPEGMSRTDGAAAATPDGQGIFYLASQRLIHYEQTSTTANELEQTLGAPASWPTTGHAMISTGSLELWIHHGDQVLKATAGSLTSSWGIASATAMSDGNDRSLAAMVYDGSRYAYIIGGAVSGLPSPDVFQVDTVTGAVSSFATLSTAVTRPGAFHLSGKVYVLGGMTAIGTTEDIQEIDIGAASCSLVTISGTIPDALSGGWEGAGCAYDADAGLAYFYGGTSVTSGGLVSYITGVHAFDPSALTLTELTTYARLYDDEDTDGTPDGYIDERATNFNYAHHAQAALTPTSEDGLQVYIFGGADQNNESPDEIQVHDVTDQLLSALSDSSYGYLRHNERVYAEEVPLAVEDFDGTDDTWTDLTSNWTQSSDHITGASGATSSLQWSLSHGHYAGMVVDLELNKTASGDHQDIEILIRGDFAESYRILIRWTSIEVWRDLSGGSTLLRSMSHTLVDGVTVTNNLRIGITEDPSFIILWDGSSRIGWAEDWSKDRIRGGAGNVQVRCLGTGGAAQINLWSATVAEWGAREMRCVSTWLLRCPPDVNPTDLMNRTTHNVFDYTRRWDDITRYSREYYYGPPRWWYQTHCCTDLSAGIASHVENGMRCYQRVYHADDVVEVDAPMLAFRTCVPQSWVPEGVTRTAEMVTWSDAAPADGCSIEIAWRPLVAPPGYEPCDLLRLRVDASNEIVLRLHMPDQRERQYNRGDFYGAHEPKLRLVKRVGGVDVASCDVVTYWGKSTGTALERFDETVAIGIWHDAAVGIGLTVRRACREGKAYALSAGSIGAGKASLALLGSGWWSEPRVREIVSETGRVLTVGRLGPRRRYLESDPYGAVLAGDLDPMRGTVNQDNPMDTPEEFDRDDSYNLGNDWDIITQTGKGFDLANNMARGEEQGWERWDANPWFRDTTIHADVSIDVVGGEVGLMQRLDYLDARYGRMHGYQGSVELTGSSTVTIRIKSLWHDAETGTQGFELLASATGTAAAGDAMTLAFEADGADLTLTLTDAADAVVATCTVEDHLCWLPGGYGIMCDTPGSGQYVWISKVWASTKATRRLPAA